MLLAYNNESFAEQNIAARRPIRTFVQFQYSEYLPLCQVQKRLTIKDDYLIR